MNVKAREWRNLDYILKRPLGNSLVLQWLGFRPFTVGAWVQSLVWELRSLKPCDSKKFKTDHSARHPFRSSSCSPEVLYSVSMKPSSFLWKIFWSHLLLTTPPPVLCPGSLSPLASIPEEPLNSCPPILQAHAALCCLWSSAVCLLTSCPFTGLG